MKRKIPFDMSRIFVIAIKNGNKNDICTALKLRDITSCRWGFSLEKVRDVNDFDENGHFETIAVSATISTWNYVVCDAFYDLKYVMNCCQDLNEKYNEMFSFSIDISLGTYRFLKIENKAITRFFDRNNNQEIGEFGVKLKEEDGLNGNDYYYVIDVVKKVLRLDTQVHFHKKLSVGKRYSHEVETYKELYTPPEKNTENQIINLQNDDLPF